MKYIKPMNGNEFAEYLLTLKTDDEIFFGVDPGVEWPDKVPDIDDVTGWYFARVIQIGKNSSRFILLDYCGGEQAFAIPLNSWINKCNEDDKEIVPDFVKTYFESYNIELNNMNDYVFVEMEDEDENS